MDIEMISKMFRTIYEEMWRTLMEVAQELPEKEPFFKSVELLPEDDDAKVGDIYRDGDSFKIVNFWDDCDEGINVGAECDQ